MVKMWTIEKHFLFLGKKGSDSLMLQRRYLHVLEICSTCDENTKISGLLRRDDDRVPNRNDEIVAW